MLFFLLWFSLLLFMPKERLYYALEEVLEKEHIQINEKSIKEGIFSFEIEEASLYVEGIKVATIENISFWTLLFYTHIEVKEVHIDSSLKNMLPKELVYGSMIHSVQNLFSASLKANGSFGVIEGVIDAKKRSIHMDFIEAKELQSIQSHLKKGDKGWYYETSF